MPVEGVRRPAWAEISSSAIAHNVRVIKSLLGGTLFCAVVKANGYGHGAQLAAKAALDGGADSLAVAIVDEGIELRGSGVSAPILLLAEIPPDTIADALSHSLTLTIGSLEGARAAVASAERLGGLHRVHLKIDTGMHRMGVAPELVDEVVDVLLAASNIDLEGVYTHFSVADGSSSTDREFTRSQIARFDAVVRSLEARDVRVRLVHAANSAGALGYPSARLSMARIGLALYGYLPEQWLASPLQEHAMTLRSALTLRARVVAVRRVEAGERPSYGRRRALERPATIATVPFGYADGYPRRLFGAGAEVLINQRRYPLAGSVTMDQLLVDVGDDEVHPGDEVVLLGRQGEQEITADDWARWAETITWEILCGIGARVPRVLVD
ncbi:MAG: alanine racemase [Acidimicrobiaceae bacterium]|nr:alanine racemase [Acidimicrobiaceae bacterium]